jgi:hypothetical protein
MGHPDEASAGGKDAGGFDTLADLAEPLGAAIEHTTTHSEDLPC